jgi:hypothetical protein
MTEEAIRVTLPSGAAGIQRVHDNLGKYEALFLEEKNPVFVWEAVGWCHQEGLDFPDWVREYLGGCAKRLMENTNALKIRDVLPRVFGFKNEKKPGRQQRALLEMFESERFPMQFAVQIFSDENRTPTEARERAREIVYGSSVKEDGDLRQELRKFFGDKLAPRTNAAWRIKIVPWLWENRHFYPTRYPQLPSPDAIFITYFGDTPN